MHRSPILTGGPTRLERSDSIWHYCQLILKVGSDSYHIGIVFVSGSHEARIMHATLSIGTAAIIYSVAFGLGVRVDLIGFC